MNGFPRTVRGKARRRYLTASPRPSKPKGEREMITREELRRMLERIAPKRWREWDWRKVSGGRVVRFVKWGGVR